MINYITDPLFWQRFLSSAGFYQGALDSDFGSQSHAAGEQFEAQSLEIARELGFFDIRTEGNIQTLLPKAQRRARQFLKDINAQLGGARPCASALRTGVRREYRGSPSLAAVLPRGGLQLDPPKGLRW